MWGQVWSRLSGRHVVLLSLVAFAGCLLPHYGKTKPEGVASGGAGDAGSEQVAAGASGSAGSAHMAGAGGKGSPAAGTGGGNSPTAGAGGAPGGCDSGKKSCGGVCVAVDDVAYGCGPDTCNQSSCPAGEANLTCNGGKCVIAGCGTGTKKCGDQCVSITDPTYGCGADTCDASSCPNPGATGTLICSGSACVVGSCTSDTKNCANKCVPLDKANGCSDTTRCTACVPSEVCTGTPAKCGCVADDVEACKGKACGKTIDNCGITITCPGSCTAPNTCGGANVPNQCGCSDPNACNAVSCGSITDKCGKTQICPNGCSSVAPMCFNNACVECNAVADCPDDSRCAKGTCLDHNCNYDPVPANTSCAGGGKCLASPYSGICIRQPASVGTFSIDPTPVTRSDYENFVGSKNGDVSGQPAMCAFNTTYVPSGNWPNFVIKELDMPVTYVNWCDALAYCKWAGKHLCGQIAGTTGVWNSEDPNVDEYTHACEGPSKTTYPYGNTYQAGKCAETGPELVATHTACVSGYAGVYDMVGNVFEWVNRTYGDGSAANPYAVETRGYEFTASALNSRCDHIHQFVPSRADQSIGFRCCK